MILTCLGAANENHLITISSVLGECKRLEELWVQVMRYAMPRSNIAHRVFRLQIGYAVPHTDIADVGLTGRFTL